MAFDWNHRKRGKNRLVKTQKYFNMAMEEEENFLKLFKLVTGPGTEAVRHIFDTLLPPATLNATLNSHKNTTIQDLKRKRRITAAQDALLFPPTGAVATSATFDLTLLICLIRNLTSVIPPTNGWDTLPSPTETSMAADIARIKFVRNLLAHTDRNVMTNGDFNTHWSSLYDAIRRQGGPGLKPKCEDIENLRLVSDVEIQDFIHQVEEFKLTLSHELKEDITEVKGHVSNLQTDINEMNQNLTGVQTDIKELKKLNQSKIPTHIQEQFKRRLDEWRKEDEKFVDTAGAQYVMKCIEENGCMSVIGNSGTGKTFTARHTALQMEQKGFLIVPLSEPQDLNYFEHDHMTLFVIDDLCGKFTLNERYLDDWKRVLEKIESYLKDKCCKIISTCRLQVYQDVNFKLSVFKKCTCNLSSHKYSLTSDEIDSFKDLYLSDEDCALPELSKDIDFYPLLFSLYKEKEDRDINTFFSRPFECYAQELDNLEDEGPGGRRKYCGLVLCVLFNNTLRKEDILGQKSSNKHAIENILLECGVEKENRRQIVKDIKALQGYFVKIVDDKFKIIHDKLFDFLAKYFGTKMIENFIKHAHFDFISKRFLWKGSNIKGKKLEYIELCDDHINLYIDRMIDIWKEGYTVSVFHNSNVLTSNRFRERFYKYLSGKPELEQEQLVGKLDNKSLSTSLFYASKINDVRGVKWMLEFPSIDVNQSDIYGWTPLHTACYNNHIDVVKELLKSDQIDVDVCENEGDSSLHLASQEGNDNVVRLLLQHSVNINKQNQYGVTPLHKACYNNHVEVVRELLRNDQTDVDVGDNKGDTSLHLASQEGNADVVRLLLQHSANINKPDMYGWTPLHKACYNNHVEVVKELLKNDKIVVDVCSNKGGTFLYLACQEGNVDVVSLMIQHSANINKQNKDGWTPLHTACYTNHIDVVTELLKTDKIDVDICKNKGNTSLNMASQEGNVDVVRLLVQHSANINKQNQNGWTPLHIACYANRIEVVKELLENEQIDLNVCTNRGDTSLYLASEQGNVDVVRLLLRSSVNVNKANEEGFTPLIIACQEIHDKIVYELLKYHADVNAEMYDGDGALISASREGSTEIVTRLLHNGSYPNACIHTRSHIINVTMRTHEDESIVWHKAISGRLSAELVDYLQKKPKDYAFEIAAGSSSLHFASLLGYVPIVKLLIQYKADVNISKEDGTTPLFFASEFGQLEVVKLLLHQGANTAKSRTDGVTPLGIAINNGYFEVVYCLMKQNQNNVDN